jgi:hypothetical protein
MDSNDRRFRYVGIIVYLFVGLFVLSTTEGIALTKGFLNGNTTSEKITQAAIAFGLGFFTSEAFGFIVASIETAIWNRWFGYDKVQWKPQPRQLIDEVVDRIEPMKDSRKRKFRNDWKTLYRRNVFSNYFWQQAPVPIKEWVARRYVAVHMAYNGITSVGLGVLIVAAIFAFAILPLPSIHCFHSSRS